MKFSFTPRLQKPLLYNANTELVDNIQVFVTKQHVLQELCFLYILLSTHIHTQTCTTQASMKMLYICSVYVVFLCSGCW